MFLKFFTTLTVLLATLIGFTTNLKAVQNDVYPIIYNVELPSVINGSSQTSMSITVNNNGKEPLTSFDINIFIDGQKELTYNFSGNINSYSNQGMTVGNYQFSKKSPLAPYEVYATISNINSGAPINEYSGTMTDVIIVNTPLDAGTYAVGNVSDDFKDIQSLNNYLNAGGFPLGDVTFNIRPGTYDTPIRLNENIDFFNQNPEVQNGKVTFQKYPNSTGKVTIDHKVEGNNYAGSKNGNGSFTPNENSNYAFCFSGYNDITIKDITINVEVDSISYEAGGIYFSGGVNLLVDNCEITLREYDYSGYVYVYSQGIYAPNSNNVTVNNCEISGGIYGIYVDSYDVCDRELTLTNNTLTNQAKFSIYANNTVYACSTYVNNALIEDNIFINTMSETRCIAIYSMNGTTISGNSLSGFKGNGNDPGPSLITVEHSNTDLDDEVTIDKNTIENVTDFSGVSVQNVGKGKISNNTIKIDEGAYNVKKSAVKYEGSGTDSKYLWAEKNTIEVENGNGIELKNTNAKVYYNLIDVISDNSSNEYAGFASDNSSGYVANNRVRGEEVNGFKTDNSGSNKNTTTGLYFCYNSVAVDSPNNCAFKVDAGANAGTSVLRNMLLNYGGGDVMIGTSMGGPIWTSNQNNLKSSASKIGTWNGSPYSSMAGFRTASSGDANSASVDVDFLEDGSLRPKEFTPDLVFGTPLFDPNGPLGNVFLECEKFDFYGNERNEFFVGFNNPLIIVTVIQEPADIYDCYGTQGRYFSTLATATSGLLPKYQWFKDGEPLLGQTFPGLNLGPLEYEMSGLFRCAITASGAADTTWTKEATLYVLQAPSITVQPKTVIATIGGDAVLYVEGNIQGKVPPYYKVDAQWYKGTTPLVDDEKYEGVNSSYLNIKNIVASDFTSNYWVKLVGNCGTLNSATVSINEAPSANFTTHPTDVVVCTGDNFEFTTNVTATNSGTISSYQWYANGNKLSSPEYNGVNSATLTGSGTMTLANVYVEVVVNPGNLTFKSNEVSLTLNTAPVIATQPQATEIEENDNGEMTIVISNPTGVTYEWFKSSNTVTVLSTDASLSFTNTQVSDGGLYYCVATNDCGDITSSSASLTVKTSGIISSVEGLRNEFKLSNSPNPTSDVTTINYTVNELADVRIVVSDMTGNEMFEMNRGLTSPNSYSLKIDADKLNLSSGVYYYTLYVGGKSVTNKLVIAK